MDLTRQIATFCIAFVFIACTQTSDNPLLDATDGQFKLSVAPYFDCLASIEKAAKTFSSATKIKGEAENERRICLEKAQKLAVGAGISDTVTFDHIQDTRVKDRYLALKSEPTK
jgi:hypothetical protein